MRKVFSFIISDFNKIKKVKMTRPFTLEEQQMNNWFIPTKRIAILAGISTFDAVCKIVRKKTTNGKKLENEEA